MMKIFIISLVFFSKTVIAQDSMVNASVLVHKDPRIDLLLKKESGINASIRKSSYHTMKGFRIMVMNTIKRDDAMAAKTKIYTYFPELKAYLQYQSPYFKLKVGNFKTRDEAVKYQKDLTAFFANGVFIISDIIEVKPEKDKENGNEK